MSTGRLSTGRLRSGRLRTGYDDAALAAWVCVWQLGGTSTDGRTLGPPTPVRERERDVFVYFDNDAKVRAPYDAITLALRLGVRSLHPPN